MLVATAPGQTVCSWTGNSDQRWSRNGNWSGNNPSDGGNELAQFGAGTRFSLVLPEAVGA